MIHDCATGGPLQKFVTTSGTFRCRGRPSPAVVSSRRKGRPNGEDIRALPWVLSLILLLAGATADGAEAVKIRASWIVAPSDWTPLFPEKPERMKNNGKSYVFEPMRFQGTPAVITALANNEIELGNLAFSSLALAIENAGVEDLRIVGDQFKDGSEGHYSNQFFVLRESPIQKVEALKGE